MDSLRFDRLIAHWCLLVIALLGGVLVGAPRAQGQRSVDSLLISLDLQSLGAFREPGSNWQLVGGVSARPGGGTELEVEAGRGILVNRPTVADRANLETDLEHRDLVLEFDVLMPEGSNSGVYLQGRYEIQLLDSWRVERPTYGDMTGIYHRWDAQAAEGERGYQGHPPRVNVSRAPGLWQHVRIVFRAARYDDSGRKTENARILEVVHNGVTVHRNVELTGPTRGGDEEGPEAAPIRIQGDHGPVAFRNILYRRYEEDSIRAAMSEPRGRPIEVQVGDAPKVMQGFVHHPDAERESFTGLPVVVDAVSVGTPADVHYAVDLEEGALLQIWRGPFVDTRQMWRARGADQTAQPMGSVITLDGAPPLARLSHPDAPWPESTGKTFRSDGYRLDEEGHPTFLYRLESLRVRDRLVPDPDGRGLCRTLTVEGDGSPETVYGRLASAPTIDRVREGLYVVGDRSYFVEFESVGGGKPRIRSRGDGEELIVPLPPEEDTRSIRYTLVW